MTDSTADEKLITIKMRATAVFKQRFDKACSFRGWSAQTALERLLAEWIYAVEQERDNISRTMPEKTPAMESSGHTLLGGATSVSKETLEDMLRSEKRRKKNPGKHRH